VEIRDDIIIGTLASCIWYSESRI